MTPLGLRTASAMSTSVEDDAGLEIVREGPSHDPAAPGIKDDREEEEARHRGHEGDVGDPELVWCVDREVAANEVACRAMRRIGPCRADASPTADTRHTRCPHQARHPLLGDRDALGPHLGVDTRCAVGTPRSGMDRSDTPCEIAIGCGARTSRPDPPGIIARGGHLEHARHDADWELGLVCAHEPVNPDGVALLSRANQAAAFDRISRSWPQPMFSRRSRTSSSRSAPVGKSVRLPSSLSRLKRFAHRLARSQVEGVTFKDGKLSITPVRADESAAAKALAARIDGLMPRVRITELLHEVARATGFPQAFLNLRTRERHDNENALLAAILADGSNLGLARMAQASQGVTPDQLVSAYIAPDNYRAALARIIDAHHALPIAAVWGQGTTSSSDGQFFRSGKRGSGAGDFNAKYGVDPGFSFYTHVSDQHGPYHVTVISAATHEAPYVLDGLLHHGSGLAIDTHYTDTGGATDHVFALCRMLGFRFCPRLRDFPDRRLACIEAPGQYPSLKQLMGTRVKVEVIREHWDEIVRLVASLKAGTVLPSAMLRKLAAYERQNQLDLALREIGRVERTLFMLDWLESPALRRRCQAGLNKSEQRHFLTQAICTFKQGRIADRTHEAQQFRASGLNLVIAAIVYWNSTYIADAVAHLRFIGEAVPDELLAHTSPVEWGHIAFSGDFLWDRAAAMPTGRRPLNVGRMSLAA